MKTTLARLAIVLTVGAAAGESAANAEGTIGTNAYPLLIDRTQANRRSLYVYEDADSALNHGFPSGFFGGPGAPAELIALDSACVDDLLSTTGCSSDPHQLDRDRGTVLSVTFNFTPGTPAEFAGVNFEEPENWGVVGGGVGWDLTGATELVLEARAPEELSVEFGVAGSTTGFIDISSEWTTYSIPLTSLAIPDPGDVHLLFTIVTNDSRAPAGGTVLLDNIRFEPAPDVQGAVLGLPLGTDTFGLRPLETPSSGCVPVPPDQVLRNLATIYEAALVVLALLEDGSPESLAAARVISDTLVYALAHENTGIPLPIAPDGSKGLHSGYSAGDIALRNGQGAGAGQAGQVRLGGFSASTELCGPSGFCLVLDGATGGNNAFAILALLAAYEELDDLAYLEAAREICRWTHQVLADTTGTGFGGYYVGYPDEGVPAPKPLIPAKSVENNADIFVAFRKLADIEAQLGNAPAAATWNQRAEQAGDFVIEMFDREGGCFSAGTVPIGTPPDPDQGLDPTGSQRGNDVINVFPFQDANTFTTLALAPDNRYRNQIDWRRPTQCLFDFEKSVTVGSGPDFEELRGFGLVKTPVCGSDGIAWEFTAQAVVTMRLVDSLYGETTFALEADEFLDSLRRALSVDPFGDGRGLVGATLQDGELLDPINQCLQTPFQCIPQRVGLAATTWAIFAEEDINPLAPPCATSLELRDGLLHDTAYLEACGPIFVGPNYTVSANGSLHLRAETVELRNGATVELGGGLSINLIR